MKAILNLAEPLEYRLLLDWPGVLEDRLFVDALRAKIVLSDSELLFKRLAVLQRLEQLKEFSINLYFTLDGVVRYHISEQRVTIRPVKKFSGYVRNSSSVGSKRSSNISIPEPENFEWEFDVKKDYFTFLTVGELTSGVPGNLGLTLKMDQKSETGKTKTKRK